MCSSTAVKLETFQRHGYLKPQLIWAIDQHHTAYVLWRAMGANL